MGMGVSKDTSKLFSSNFTANFMRNVKYYLTVLTDNY